MAIDSQIYTGIHVQDSFFHICICKYVYETIFGLDYISIWVNNYTPFTGMHLPSAPNHVEKWTEEFSEKLGILGVLFHA